MGSSRLVRIEKRVALVLLRILILPTFNRYRRGGFTLIEVLVVLTLVGAASTLLYQLLQTVWAEQLSGVSPLQIQQFFKFGRDKALENGTIMTMVIDSGSQRNGYSRVQSFT